MPTRHRLLKLAQIKNINVSMDIYGHGDTALSESAAKEVAINYAEIVNKDLGVIITVN